MLERGVLYFHFALGIANYGVVLAHAVGNFYPPELMEVTAVTSDHEEKRKALF